MPVPLIPIIAGVAVGAAATYVYKDKSSRKTLKKSIKTARKRTAEGINRVKSALQRNQTQSKQSNSENSKDKTSVAKVNKKSKSHSSNEKPED